MSEKSGEDQLATATFAKLQEIRFLDPQNRDRIGRYELMMQTLRQRNNITQDEINTTLRTLISSTVNEEFNRISFLLENSRTFSARSHSAVLTRNPQNGHYTLSYGGAYTNNETRIITANSLEALSHEMRNGNNRADFDETGISAVRTQAGLIPAMTLSDGAMNEIKSIITNFYITPNTETYAELLDIHILYNNRALRDGGNPAFRAITNSYENTLGELNDAIGIKVLTDTTGQISPRSISTAQQQRLLGLR